MLDSKKQKTSESSSSQQALEIQTRVELEIRRRTKTKAESLKKKLRRWKENFVDFAGELEVSPKDGGDPIPVRQSGILKLFEDARTGRDYVLKPRQVYMTTWELARDIWFFLTRPGVRVVVLCQSDKDNSAPKEISGRLVTMFESLRRKHPDVPFAKVSDTKWVRTDGSKSELRIMGAGATEKSASKKGRSGTIHRLHITEVAFFEYATETLTAITECVPGPESGSEITFESTPRGAAGFFYEGYNAAKSGKNEYRAHFYRWFEQPEYRTKLNLGETISPETEREKELVELHKISPEQLKWYRQKVADPSKGQAKVDQEYPSDEETCWLFDGRLFFDKEALAKLRQTVANPINKGLSGAFKRWVFPEKEKEYVVAVDPSNGVGGDPAAAVVFERLSGRHCATLSGQFAPDVLAMHVAAIGWTYNQALIVVERSSSQMVVHNTLVSWKRPNDEGTGYPRIFVDKDRQYGFKMTPASRPGILDGLEVAIRTGAFKTFDLELVKEALLFIVQDEKPQAAPGAHDDRIMASAIAWNLLSVPIGLRHTDFAQAPSIAYANTPIAFEGLTNEPSIDDLVHTEQRRWADGPSNMTDGAFAAVILTNQDFEGF